MSKDNGNWLSAEQAVLPDGTERDNLPLIKKKLPLFSPAQAQAPATRAQTQDGESIAAQDPAQR